MPPIRLTSPSLRRISCSILRCPMTGWSMPPMLTWEVTAEISRVIFNVTSRPPCHRGGMGPDARVVELAALSLHDRHIHYSLRLGFVEVIDQFLSQRHLVGRAPHHDGALRGQLLDPAHLQNRAHGIDHILQLGRLRKI